MTKKRTQIIYGGTVSQGKKSLSYELINRGDREKWTIHLFKRELVEKEIEEIVIREMKVEKTEDRPLIGDNGKPVLLLSGKNKGKPKTERVIVETIEPTEVKKLRTIREIQKRTITNDVVYFKPYKNQAKNYAKNYLSFNFKKIDL